MTPLCQSETTLPGGFMGVSGVTVRLMNDRQLMRLDRLAELFDGEPRPHPRA
jgi:hypothetical protein